MEKLLHFARRIDATHEKIGQLVSWLIFGSIMVSSVNATVRYIFNYSSNAYLELQWYLFAATFLLGASWTLSKNEHIRIDVITHRFSFRVHAWIDILGCIFFLTPLCLLMLYESVPFALYSIQTQEISTNSGGLIVWPSKLLIPLGFLLLQIQAFSEIIKRVGVLKGLVDPKEFEKQSHSGDDVDAEVAAYKRALEEANLKAKRG